MSSALNRLREEGVLLAPLPRAFGGQGLGTEPAGAASILSFLRSVGGTRLALGRLLEGHINAIRLIVRYGTPEQCARAAADAASGHLFAIWAAEAPNAPVRLRGGVLVGRKTFASGVGCASRAVVTAMLPDGREQLAYVASPPSMPDGTYLALHGMEDAATAPVWLDGLAAEAIGEPGDYMRQPEISLGAWRPLAVILGGLDTLLAALRNDLLTRHRDADPRQRTRFARAALAHETARLWVERCAELAEAADAGEEAANYVKLARLAVEAAVLDAITLAQRSAGLAAFAAAHPLERVARDLSTYLRQPALDEALEEAGEYFLHDDTSLAPHADARVAEGADA